jgi:hypothetical protein
MELANGMRPQAAEIRIHNAQISNYQGMLGGLSAAESGERRSQVQITYNKIENRWQTLIINKQSAPQVEGNDSYISHQCFVFSRVYY